MNLVLGRKVLYLVGGKSGPPLQDNYVDSLQADLEAFLGENLKPSEFIQHIVNSVDTKFPDKVKGAKPLEELCAI